MPTSRPSESPQMTPQLISEAFVSLVRTESRIVSFPCNCASRKEAERMYIPRVSCCHVRNLFPELKHHIAKRTLRASTKTAGAPRRITTVRHYSFCPQEPITWLDLLPRQPVVSSAAGRLLDVQRKRATGNSRNLSKNRGTLDRQQPSKFVSN